MATHVNDFGTGSVKKRILSQAIPLMMAQAVQLLYNVVDRIYIGHLKDIGDIAMTGLGITFPVIVIIASFTSLYGSGGTVLFSIERGRDNKEEAEKILGNVVALHLVSAIVLFLFCYLLKRPILYLFGASDQSIVYADQYIRIYLFGTLFSMLSTGLNGFINAQGHPRVGMMTTIIGAIVNIILDPVFIFIFKMGVAGAAVATVLSQAVSAIWVLHYLLSYDTELRIKKEYVTIDGRRTKEIVTLGFPGFVMQATGGLVQIASNNQLQIYGGDMYVTIFTILNSIRDIIQLPVYALTSGASPVLGYNYGAEKYERVKEAIRFTTVFSGLYTIVAWLIIVFEPHFFMGMFSNNPVTIEEGCRMLFIYFFGFVFMTFQFSGQTAFQALGKAKFAIFFSTFRKVVLVVPLTFILPAIGFGVEGVFLAEAVSNIVGSLLCYITMYFTLYRKL